MVIEEEIYMQLTKNFSLPKLAEQLKRHEGAVKKNGSNFQWSEAK